MSPYRWHVLITITFFFVITFVFFAVATASKEKVNIQTTSVEQIAAPTVSFIDPQVGATTPLVTIVEYADFTCESCASLAPNLAQLINKYPNDVKLVWKDFPNESRNDQATPAAIAARCAQDQDAFWQYHDQLFLYQASLSHDVYVTIAETLELNSKTFEKCLSDNEPLPRVRKAFQEGLALSITATPTIFINSERYTGSVSFTDLDALVKSIRSQQK